MAGQRTAEVQRETKETKIKLRLNLDGTGNCQIETELGFFNHMLSLWTRHASFDMELTGQGDLVVDAHHTVEDIAICLGRAIREALGDKAGIVRFGHSIIPMDEALALVAVDISGRGYLAFEGTLPAARVGDFDTELVEEFLRALAMNGEFTLHVRLLAGRNSHHICEVIFKSLGRALHDAVSFDNRVRDIPSTKGVI
ncbi:MAG TPA: imidazoleglycerol-phosphate dehydratase HisB [Desulfotomaculum sp.]|nr:imidazoleglycerol-phosphate dehydratase HisB [Desulfotomaculum sp.]